MKTKSKKPKTQPGKPRPLFLRDLKRLMQAQRPRVQFHSLDRYAKGVSRELRGGQRPFTVTSASALAEAIWRLHDDPSPEKTEKCSVRIFWRDLGKMLNGGKRLPSKTDFDEFKQLFIARLGFGPTPFSDKHSNAKAKLAEEYNKALNTYRRIVAEARSRIPLRGMDVGASDPTSGQKQLELDQVYVGLDTTTRISGNEHGNAIGNRDYPLTALAAVARHRCVVLLGDPGSGKSTFLNHLALCLAKNVLEPEKNWLQNLTGWELKEGKISEIQIWPQEESNLLPVPVILRDFAQWLADQKTLDSACPLWDFIARHLRNPTLEAVEHPLHEALEQGRALVLLDGLDEIPSDGQRIAVKKSVLDFVRLHRRSRILITCRTLSYQNPAWQLPSMPAFILAPFSEEKINKFIQSWHKDLVQLNTLKKETADKLAQKLSAAICRPDLRLLAPNPLLLTVMALVHTHKGELPDARALLYEDAVEILLWRWEQLKADGDSDAPRIRQLLRDARRSDVDLKRKLWRLAFDAHSAAKPGDSDSNAADIGELTLLEALSELPDPPDYGWAKKMIEALTLRAGLLLERMPHVFTFPHRTFQEYLAASHLVAQPNFTQYAVKLVGEGAFWREVILLTVGKLVYFAGDTDKPVALAGELCPERGDQSDVAWRQVWLAGDVLNEITIPRIRESALGRDFLARVPCRLADLVEAGALSPVERAKAGIVLGKLGDPRPGIGIIETKPGRPDIVWCGAGGEVKTGAGDPLKKAFPKLSMFKIGEPKGRKERAYGSFTQFNCTRIKKPFFISKYPVTFAQYQLFVEAKGYKREFADDEKKHRLWTPDGWRWLTEKNVTAPENYSPVFQTPNHPRVGVSWYEARAYAAWLNSPEIQPHLRRDLGLPENTGVEIRLPTEAEWEMVARWNTDKGEADDRLYPWGDEKTETELSKRCNWQGAKIGSTTAVGLFPEGHSKCGAGDLAGNVWEWCQTKWIKPDDKDALKQYNSDVYDEDDGDGARVLRGGSWGFDAPGNLRSSGRISGRPGSRNLNVGFRVVCVGASAR
jgi:formylglycine-generating enzyme required for sulfatase activity/energy-coupling factor transporter ATP-binding protein EcfA2